MKLELKHIVPYLPYGLKVKHEGSIETLWSLNYRGDAQRNKECSFRSVGLIKPLLRPIKSITIEEATEFGNVLLGEYEMEDREAGIGSIEMGNTITPILQFRSGNDDDDDILVFFGGDGISCDETVSYEAYDWLFEHHFDIFGLIEKGLAIAKEA